MYSYKSIYTGQINFNKEEIDEVKHWDIGEIKSNIGSGILSDNFEHEFKMYLNGMT
ncbi:NUDIX hydrolase [Candidatus Magnetoovum chiemensis]|nr:NUDIX hydrolase [Candidatus Magnetoovum chiemensis]